MKGLHGIIFSYEKRNDLRELAALDKTYDRFLEVAQ